MNKETLSNEIGIKVKSIEKRAKKWNVKINKSGKISANDALFVSYKTYKPPTVEITFEQYHRIIELYMADSGMHKKEIAGLANVSMDRVYEKINVFKKHGGIILQSKMNYLNY